MKSISRLTRLVLISLALALSGCSTTPYNNTINFNSKLEAKVNKAEINTRLMAQYKEWRGIPYRHGGLNKRGIDCSGFVYLTYRNKFGINLPRSTEQQSHIGIQVDPRAIRAGDLVFFSSLFTDTHVGIYLSNRKFLHASTSRGVMISNMDNDYWRDKFWKALRI